MMIVKVRNFLYPYKNHLNFTGHEKFIIEEIKRFSKVDWFKNQKGSFGKHFSVPFAETITKRGVAFTFNVMNFDQLLEKER